MPVDVTGLQSVRAIGTGGKFSCAVVTGRIKCWGDNSIGQLGNGTREDTQLPVETRGISSAEKVDGGSFHTCALLHEGIIKCWGINYGGQLGNGTEDDLTRPVEERSVNLPVEVIGIKSARDVTTGLVHSCALEGKTTVKCWGANINGGYFSTEVGLSTSKPIVIKVIP